MRSVADSPSHSASRARARTAGSARRLAVAIGLAMLVGLDTGSPAVAAEAETPESRSRAAEGETPRIARIVSLNPSLTAIVVALGAGATLIGIDDYSARLLPELAARPRVGGLFSPSLEAVVALHPDVVVLVPSVEQREFRKRLEGLGIRVEEFENIRFEQVIENIERLGGMVGREDAAQRRIAAIELARRSAAERGAAARAERGDALRVAIAVQRDPLFLVGRGGFIAEMLATLGARNVGDAFDDAYPRVSIEWLVAQAPDVVIDLSDDSEAARIAWERFPSLPAVRNDRVHAVDAGRISLPGPDLDGSLELLGDVLYGAAPAESDTRP